MSCCSGLVYYLTCAWTACQGRPCMRTGSSEFISGRDSMLIDLSLWYKGSLAPKIEVIQRAMNLHPHAVRSASRSPDPMEMVSLAAVPLASFKPPFERRLAVRTRAVHKPSIRRLFAFGIPFRVFIPQPGSGSMSGMSLLPDARETGSH